MRKFMLILIMTIFAGCHVFAQTEGVEKLMERYKAWQTFNMKNPDTIRPVIVYGNKAMDCNYSSADADTTCNRPIVCLDKVYYNTKVSDSFRPEIRYDGFKEKMNEPWLGDILKDCFFR